jgi:hypothetical protein
VDQNACGRQKSEKIAEKAAEIARQAMRRAPDRVNSYGSLAADTLALQRFDETRQIIREAQARKLGY